MTVLSTGLIGDHISQSRFPAALELLCADAGITLEFERIDTANRPDFDFPQTVQKLQAAGWNGVSVTHPYKTQAAQFAAGGMAEDARSLGAANTLVFGDRISGFNTDFTGFLSAWRSEMGDQPVGTVAMAGAGGVARALGPALVKLGARKIWIWDASPARARDLVAVIGPRAEQVDQMQADAVILHADGVVNATPLGMAHHPGSAFKSELITRQKWAFDAVYTPTYTEFLQHCAAAGLRILSGFELFRHMALRSFETYAGVAPDSGKMLPLLDGLRPERGSR